MKEKIFYKLSSHTVTHRYTFELKFDREMTDSEVEVAAWAAIKDKLNLGQEDGSISSIIFIAKTDDGYLYFATFRYFEDLDYYKSK